MRVGSRDGLDSDTISLELPSSLGDLIGWRARRTPLAEALVGSTRRWTWAEAAQSVNAVAGVLAEHGIGPGDHVAIHRAKTAESLLGVWAILTAGAVAVPVDPYAAPDVAAGIMVDAEAVAVLNDRRRASQTPAGIQSVDLAVALASSEPTEPPLHRARSLDDTAYLIFTSGSTGRPKGIVHTHRSALAYARLAVDTYGFDARDRVAGMSPLHFDMSTLELYAAPLAGAAIVVMDDALMRFPASVTERSEAEKVTVWYTVPYFLRQVAARGALEERDLGSLRWLLYGGEPYSPRSLCDLVGRLGRDLFVSNVYGPAEVNQCTVWSGPARSLDPEAPDVPLGTAWLGARIAVVGDDGLRVDRGAIGELMVEADTAMTGYWRQPELTADRLGPRPALGRGRWYATGDLVWEDDHGLLHYVGRQDHQVKIRGMRMELEGIESVLSDAPGVVHAVAGPTPTSDALVAAIIPDGASFDSDAVVEYVRERLHPAAVPVHVEVYRDFPTTPSGKIDRSRVRQQLLETQT